AAMSDAGYPVVGVPKTIDNDLSATEFCIGFDTAVGVVVEALDRLHTAGSADHRVMVVELTGRHSGRVAVVGGLAGEAGVMTVPGHLQRRGSPSTVGRIWAPRLGVAAVDLLKEQRAGLIPVRKDGEVAVVPLREVIKETRHVPRELYDLARVFV